MTDKNVAAFGIYSTLTQAEQAVDALVRDRFSNDDISVLAPDRQGTKDFAHEKHTKAPEGATTGVAAGGAAVWGLAKKGDPKGSFEELAFDARQQVGKLEAARWRGAGPTTEPVVRSALGWPDVVFAFHDDEELGPRMLARIAKHTGLRPQNL